MFTLTRPSEDVLLCDPRSGCGYQVLVVDNTLCVMRCVCMSQACMGVMRCRRQTDVCCVCVDNDTGISSQRGVALAFVQLLAKFTWTTRHHRHFGSVTS